MCCPVHSASLYTRQWLQGSPLWKGPPQLHQANLEQLPLIPRPTAPNTTQYVHTMSLCQQYEGPQQAIACTSTQSLARTPACKAVKTSFKQSAQHTTHSLDAHTYRHWQTRHKRARNCIAQERPRMHYLATSSSAKSAFLAPARTSVSFKSRSDTAHLSFPSC